jgi:hypothetical protein
MPVLLACVFIALFFYVAIPGAGGLVVRSRWKKFRDRVRGSALEPSAEFVSCDGDGPLGSHRFSGYVEALEGRDVLWVRGENLTVRVEMTDASVYILPSAGEGVPGARDLLEERLPEDCPRRQRWRQVTALSERSRVFLSGSLEVRDSMPVFRGSGKRPLLAVLHEGRDPIPRAVWSGRQKNEYWNALTPWSLMTGALALFIIAAFVLRSPFPRDSGRWALALALAPLVPLAPPGLVLFLVYLSAWRRARFLRAESDFLALGAFLRAADASDVLADWGKTLPEDTVPLVRSCRRRALFAEIRGAAAFVMGTAVNAYLLVLLLRAFL